MFRCPTKRAEQRGRWKPSRSPAATGSRSGPGKDYLSFSRIYEHNLFLRWSLNCTADLLISLLFVFRSPCRREWAVLEVFDQIEAQLPARQNGQSPRGPLEVPGPWKLWGDCMSSGLCKFNWVCLWVCITKARYQHQMIAASFFHRLCANYPRVLLYYTSLQICAMLCWRLCISKSRIHLLPWPKKNIYLTSNHSALLAVPESLTNSRINLYNPTQMSKNYKP